MNTDHASLDASNISLVPENILSLDFTSERELNAPLRYARVGALPENEFGINLKDALHLFDLPDLEKAAKWQWAIDRSVARLPEISERLEAAAEKRGVDITGHKVLLNGSMASHHFTGPKPIQHSLNLFNAKTDKISCMSGELISKNKITHVIEGDLRIVFPYGSDPSDPVLQEIVEEALGGKETIHKKHVEQILRWDVPMNTVHFYQYEPLDDIPGCENVVMEYEVSTNHHFETGDYMEIASVWDQVFTEEEIYWQVRIREALRALKSPLEEEFNPTKSLHCHDCRWRIIASSAMSKLLEAGDPRVTGRITLEDLPLTGEAPGNTGWIVDAWLSGEESNNKASTLGRPTEMFAEGAVERIQSAIDWLVEISDDISPDTTPEELETVFTDYLLLEPEVPEWVKVAMEIQQDLVKMQVAV